MHLCCILVPTFLIVLVQSTPFRERYVLNRVPISIEKQSWFQNIEDKSNKQKDVNNENEAADYDNKSAKSNEENYKKNEGNGNAVNEVGGGGEKPIKLPTTHTSDLDDGDTEKKDGKGYAKPIRLPITHTSDLDGGDTEKKDGEGYTKPIRLPITHTSDLDGGDTEKKDGKGYAKPIRLPITHTSDLDAADIQKKDGGDTEKKDGTGGAKPIRVPKNYTSDLDAADTQKEDGGDTEKKDGVDGEEQMQPKDGEQIKKYTEKLNDGKQKVEGKLKVDGDDEVVIVGSDNGQYDTKGKDKVGQQGSAFQKYHAEKVNHMQEAMASNWPLGIIPYKFDTSSFDNILAVRVRDAMDFLESASCVQFKALSGRKPESYSWIHITNPEKERECSHKPKRKSSGEIVLILGLECLKRRDILHSLLHAIGFNDEVTHPHRDQYIRVMWENVQPKYQSLFAMLPGERKVLVEYDPMSIMHFHDRAFSRNGQATIVPLMPGLQIQPSDKLSQLDKMKLRLAFGHECNRRTVDDLFDTCKTVMHKQTKGEEDEESQNNNQVKNKHKPTIKKDKKKKKKKKEKKDKKSKLNGMMSGSETDNYNKSSSEEYSEYSESDANKKIPDDGKYKDSGTIESSGNNGGNITDTSYSDYTDSGEGLGGKGKVDKGQPI